MSKRLAWLSVLIWPIWLFSACAAHGPVHAPEKPGREIGAVITDMIDPYKLEFVEAGNEAAADFKTRVSWKVSGFDLESQTSFIGQLIDKNVHCLMIDPYIAKGLEPFVVKACKAGIPVVAVDSRIDTGCSICTLHDDYADAFAAARILANLTGKSGKIALITGKEGNYLSDERKAGFLAGMKEFAGITVVQASAEDTPTALEAVRQIMAKYPDIKCLHIARGDLAAVSGEALGKGVLLSGHGIGAEDLALVRDGIFAFCVTAGARRSGYWNVQLAARLANGHEFDKLQYQSSYFVMDDGFKTKVQNWGLADGIRIVDPGKAELLFGNYRVIAES